MAVVVGLEPTVRGIKPVDIFIRILISLKNSSYPSHASYALSGKSKKLLSLNSKISICKNFLASLFNWLICYDAFLDLDQKKQIR